MTGRWRIEVQRKGQRFVKVAETRAEAEAIDRDLKNGTVELPEQRVIQMMNQLVRGMAELAEAVKLLGRPGEDANAGNRSLEAEEPVGTESGPQIDAPQEHVEAKQTVHVRRGARFHELGTEDLKALDS